MLRYIPLALIVCHCAEEQGKKKCPDAQLAQSTQYSIDMRVSDNLCIFRICKGRGKADVVCHDSGRWMMRPRLGVLSGANAEYRGSVSSGTAQRRSIYYCDGEKKRRIVQNGRLCERCLGGPNKEDIRRESEE